MSSSPTSSSSSEASAPSPFDALGELRLPVTVVLGTASITVRQCLALERHAVLRLEQAAGEDLWLDVNGVTLARGEVTIVDTNTSIRLTELTSAPGRSRRP